MFFFSFFQEESRLDVAQLSDGRLIFLKGVARFAFKGPAAAMCFLLK